VLPKHYNRKRIRTMDRISLLATRATEIALEDAGLSEDTPERREMGVAYGSSAGGIRATIEFGTVANTKSTKPITATSYVRMMPHTCAANISIFFKMTGRLIPTASACTSGSQALGYAYESIRWGRQDLMVAGGAEELSVAHALAFDVMFAASTLNDTPEKTPRPFDRDRDGLVVGEGGSTFILEELEHALARGAPIHAELVGFGTNANATHVTQPYAPVMKRCMEVALDDAELGPEAIGYINAHATATDLGDIVEAQATNELFGPQVPISALKSYTGHTLGASSSFEAMVTIKMMQDDWFAPTINLDNIDPQCPELDHIVGDGRDMSTEYVMSNNFAFGGVNTSLIFKRWNA